MIIDIIFVLITSIFVGVGSIMLVIYQKSRDVSSLLNTTLERTLGSEKEAKVFPGTHYKMSKYEYNRWKLQISVATGIVGIMIQSNGLITFAVIGYILFYPKQKFRKIKTPFGIISDTLIKKDKSLKNDELLEVLSLLKNMMIQLRDNPKGADYIIEYLSGTAELTKPAFFKFLNLIRLGKPIEAEKVFSNEIGTQLAADTARILIQLDRVEPIMLEQNLVSIQNEMREIGSTYKHAKNELLSDLILIPIIITIMFEFLNFLVTAYIGQLAQLSYFFNM